MKIIKFKKELPFNHYFSITYNSNIWTLNGKTRSFVLTGKRLITEVTTGWILILVLGKYSIMLSKVVLSETFLAQFQ